MPNPLMLSMMAFSLRRYRVVCKPCSTLEEFADEEGISDIQMFQRIMVTAHEIDKRLAEEAKVVPTREDSILRIRCLKMEALLVVSAIGYLTRKSVPQLVYQFGSTGVIYRNNQLRKDHGLRKMKICRDKKLGHMIEARIDCNREVPTQKYMLGILLAWQKTIHEHKINIDRRLTALGYKYTNNAIKPKQFS